MAGGAMVTAVNSARGVFTEIAVGRCFVIRCSAHDHDMQVRDEQADAMGASTKESDTPLLLG